MALFNSNLNSNLTPNYEAKQYSSPTLVSNFNAEVGKYYIVGNFSPDLIISGAIIIRRIYQDAGNGWKSSSYLIKATSTTVTINGGAVYMSLE